MLRAFCFTQPKSDDIAGEGWTRFDLKKGRGTESASPDGVNFGINVGTIFGTIFGIMTIEIIN